MTSKAKRLPYSDPKTFDFEVKSGPFKLLSKDIGVSRLRIGVVIPKYLVKKAVERHKLKRNLLVALQKLALKPKDYLIVLVRPLLLSDVQKEISMLSSRL